MKYTDEQIKEMFMLALKGSSLNVDLFDITVRDSNYEFKKIVNVIRDENYYSFRLDLSNDILKDAFIIVREANENSRYFSKLYYEIDNPIIIEVCECCGRELCEDE